MNNPGNAAVKLSLRALEFTRLPVTAFFAHVASATLPAPGFSMAPAAALLVGAQIAAPRGETRSFYRCDRSGACRLGRIPCR